MEKVRENSFLPFLKIMTFSDQRTWSLLFSKIQSSQTKKRLAGLSWLFVRFLSPYWTVKVTLNIIGFLNIFDPAVDFSTNHQKPFFCSIFILMRHEEKKILWISNGCLLMGVHSRSWNPSSIFCAIIGYWEIDNQRQMDSFPFEDRYLGEK